MWVLKLIFAVVNNDDSASVAGALTRAGFSATKLATTGGFLRAGNTTFLIGVDDHRVNDVIDIIANCSNRRNQTVSEPPVYGAQDFTALPVEVSIGGATIFVTNVERFEKF